MNKSEAGKLGYEKTKKHMEEYRKQRSLEAKEKYLSSPKTCPNCNSPIPYKGRNNKFCSSSCSATHNNKTRERKKNSKKCVSCNSSWYITRSNRNNKYCSSCISNEKHINRKESTEDAKCDGTRRRILLRTRPHKCSECNRKTWNGDPIPLQMHHIDGNPTNNKEENLCLVCPNCHAQTESFGNKNKGKGRACRYKKAS